MIDYVKELETRGFEPYESGDGYVMMNCPLPDHEDDDPSFSMSVSSGRWRCFGCEERGSFPELISVLDDISVKEANDKLRSGADVDSILASVEKLLEDEDDSIQYLSMQSFHNVFPPVKEGSPGWKYLIGRKLTPETIRRYDFRWGDHGKYEDRVILPIRMPDGKLLSYVGRTIHKNAKPKTRKARSPARTFYGIYELTRFFVNNLSDLEYIVIVEGEFDAVYLQQLGIPAVSNMGTSVINKYQLRILRSTRAKVVLCYDSDESGEKAMYGDGKRRVGELNSLNKYLKTVVVRLPDGSDPNDNLPDTITKLFRSYIRRG